MNGFLQMFHCSNPLKQGFAMKMNRIRASQEAFWGLLLPVTVHGRVSDIWRAYLTQKLLWDDARQSPLGDQRTSRLLWSPCIPNGQEMPITIVTIESRIGIKFWYHFRMFNDNAHEIGQIGIKHGSFVNVFGIKKEISKA